MKPFDFASLWKPEVAPWEVAIRAALVYAFVHALFRVVGRKEFSRWGPSDVVLLFLVAAAARKTLVVDDPSLTSAMVALTTLVALDWAMSKLTARSRRAADALEGAVRQLVRDGVPQREVMRRTRISEDQLLEHVRQHGRASLDDVQDAFLERSGKITVVLRDRAPPRAGDAGEAPP